MKLPLTFPIRTGIPIVLPTLTQLVLTLVSLLPYYHTGIGSGTICAVPTIHHGKCKEKIFTGLENSKVTIYFIFSGLLFVLFATHGNLERQMWQRIFKKGEKKVEFLYSNFCITSKDVTFIPPPSLPSIEFFPPCPLKFERAGVYYKSTILHWDYW